MLRHETMPRAVTLWTCNSRSPLQAANNSAYTGLSPRARGNERQLHEDRDRQGSIPACAGERHDGETFVVVGSIPACAGTVIGSVPPVRWVGLSPLRGGTLSVTEQSCGVRGIVMLGLYTCQWRRAVVDRLPQYQWVRASAGEPDRLQNRLFLLSVTMPGEEQTTAKADVTRLQMRWPSSSRSLSSDAKCNTLTPRQFGTLGIWEMNSSLRGQRP